MIEACNKLDIEIALTYFLDSPDFMGIGPDGVPIDFAQFKKANEDMSNAARSMQFTNIGEDFKVLGNDQVLYIYRYNAEMILNSGEKIVYDKLAMTSLCKKVEGVWKIIFYHESGLPPVVTKLSE
ncbi:MAG: nuclear transport factor 2 family protein [Bacteroidales bacterium]|nr:nuclear transport factor 2 family protein [Bacteroidales bacterium]